MHKQFLAIKNVTFQQFKVTPLNYPPRLSFELDVKYTFKSTLQEYGILRIGFVLTSENNTYCGAGFHDGEAKDVFVIGGERLRVFLKPEKYLFQEDREICRHKPFNDILYRNIANLISQKCNKLCRLPNYWQCGYLMYLSDLPVCKNHTESQCFIDVRDQEKKNIPNKPCTKLQYKTETDSWPLENEAKNEAELIVDFVSHFKVQVKEEYFIFDLVSVISAIGGTLGLCTGFSFTQLYAYLCHCVMFCVQKTITWHTADQ